MSEQSSYMQNIDKIAYGGAAVVGVLLLSLPFFLGGDVSKLAADIEQKTSRLEDLSRADTDEAVKPDGVETLVKQWEPPASHSAKPRWATERKPGIVRAYKPAGSTGATHLPAHVQSISVRRDPDKEKAYLEVVWAPAAGNKNCKVTKATLKRRVGLDGDFEAITVLENDTYTDHDVEPGVVYSYAIETVAEVVGATAEWAEPAAAAGTKEPTTVASEGLGPTQPVPYDLSFRISRFIETDPTDPKVVARVDYWDYKEDKAVLAKASSTYSEGDKVAGGRYTLRRILPSKEAVVLRSDKIRNLLIRKMTTPLPVDMWDAPLEREAAAVEEEAEPAPPPKRATRTRTPTKKKATTSDSDDSKRSKTKTKRRKSRGFK